MSSSAVITAIHTTPAGKGRIVNLLKTTQDASLCLDISRALNLDNGPSAFDDEFDDNDGIEMPISKLTDLKIDLANHLVNGVAITDRAITHIASAVDRLCDLINTGDEVRLFYSIA